MKDFTDKDKEENKHNNKALYSFVLLLICYEIILLFFMIKN